MIGGAMGVALSRFFLFVVLTALAARFAVRISGEDRATGWCIRALVLVGVAIAFGYV